MKIILNKGYNLFQIPEELLGQIPCEDEYDDSLTVRTNPIFVEWVEEHWEDSDLQVVVLPDNITDVGVEIIDDMEFLVYVVNGEYHLL